MARERVTMGEFYCNEDKTPLYNVDSAPLQKFRRATRKQKLAKWSKAERQQYGAAVEAAVLSAQRSSLKRESKPFSANCASGTFHSDGASIHKAIRAQQRAMLERLAKRDRNKTPEQWQKEYEEAMAEKRKAK